MTTRRKQLNDFHEGSKCGQSDCDRHGPSVVSDTSRKPERRKDRNVLEGVRSGGFRS